MSDKVVTRIAPSPTGSLHVGTVRTALFNYLFAKQNKGEFILRLEDTDKERSKKEFERDIVDGFAWVGIQPDRKIGRQSEREQLYRDAIRTLIENGSAYEAEESEKGSGKVIRFKNPNTTIDFTDRIRGKVTFDTTELGDFVIARDETKTLYHLGVVVDDGEMEVSHVVRGEEHLSNTPRQILILEALEYPRPVYAHVPLLLAADKSKLSKRHGAVSVNEYKEAGYLPEALINYLALLGWHPRDDRELFSMDELIKEFDLSRVQKGGAVFDLEKLRSINKKYLQKMPDGELFEEAKKHLPEALFGRLRAKKGLFEALLPLFRERIEIFSDIREIAENGELDYFIKEPKYDNKAVVWKDDNPKDTRKYLEHIVGVLSSFDTTFVAEKIKEALWEYASDQGRGSVLWPMRYALSGRDRSPDPFILAAILGREETIKRLNHAIQILS